MSRYCTVPFDRFEIFEDRVSCCCPNYLPSGSFNFNIGDPELNLLDLWNHTNLLTIREQFCNGNYSSCLSENCGIVSKNLKAVPKKYKKLSSTPRHVKLSFDQACNLHCRSCRPRGTLVRTNENVVERLLYLFERDLGKTVEKLELDGAGDPFFSKTYRNWMVGFDPVKYPNLERIKFHTNAQLFTEKFWKEELTLIRPFVKEVEISVDAATKETYEKIRLGGKWEQLFENLRFIFSILELEEIDLDFVVQKDNYPEIDDFFRLFKAFISNYNIPRKYRIFYSRVIRWPYVPEEQFNEINIPDSEIGFIRRLIDSVSGDSQIDVVHNF